MKYKLLRDLGTQFHGKRINKMSIAKVFEYLAIIKSKHHQIVVTSELFFPARTDLIEYTIILVFKYLLRSYVLVTQILKIIKECKL